MCVCVRARVCAGKGALGSVHAYPAVKFTARAASPCITLHLRMSTNKQLSLTLLTCSVCACVCACVYACTLHQLARALSFHRFARLSGWAEHIYTSMPLLLMVRVLGCRD